MSLWYFIIYFFLTSYIKLFYKRVFFLTAAFASPASFSFLSWATYLYKGRNQPNHGSLHHTFACSPDSFCKSKGTKRGYSILYAYIFCLGWIIKKIFICRIGSCDQSQPLILISWVAGGYEEGTCNLPHLRFCVASCTYKYAVVRHFQCMVTAIGQKS